MGRPAGWPGQLEVAHMISSPFNGGEEMTLNILAGRKSGLYLQPVDRAPPVGTQLKSWGDRVLKKKPDAATFRLLCFLMAQ